MAIPDPVEIPSLVGFRSITFDPMRKQQITPGGVGALQTIERALPMWMAEYATPPLIGDKYNEAIAWLDGLEGALNPFLAYDPRRIMPYAYRHLTIASDPWTLAGQTAPRITSADYANSTITMDRLANGAVITKGDYVSFYDGTAWWLYRVGQTVTAAANTATVKVGPRPRSIVGGPFNIRYRKACCAMKIIGGYEAPADVETPTAITFKAYQFIKRSV